MKTTVIIYGTSTGTCEDLAGRIGAKLGVDNVINVTDLDASVLADNENLILGTSTWGAGEMQDDWYDGIKTLKGADLSGKTVALFGCGDSESYPDTFVGGMAELYNAVKAAGANVIGAVATDDYTFDDSESVVDGKFVGLALDEVNEDDKTDERIDAWVAEIKPCLYTTRYKFSLFQSIIKVRNHAAIHNFTSRHEGSDEPYLRIQEGSAPYGALHVQQEIRGLCHTPTGKPEH